MSSLTVNLVPIKSITKVPGADTLFSHEVLGWSVISKGIETPSGWQSKYTVGSKVLYCPIDSILSHKLENILFPEGSKVVLSKSRIKTIKLRKSISQGMILDKEELSQYYPELSKSYKEDFDYAAILGITKYEPLAKEMPQGMQTKSTKIVNPLFHKYTDLDHYKKYSDIIPEGTEVILTEKIHGTSARYGVLPTTTNTLWKKFLKLIGVLPKYEQCIGSRNVQIHLKGSHKGYYGVDVYSKTDKQYKITSKLPNGYCVYGEIYGPSIQKGYHYGLKNDETAFRAFDVSFNGKYLNYRDALDFLKHRSIPVVPVLYYGPLSKEVLDKYVGGASVLEPSQKVREGLVIKPIIETHHASVGRVALKFLNPEYLLKDQSEFH